MPAAAGPAPSRPAASAHPAAAGPAGDAAFAGAFAARSADAAAPLSADAQLLLRHIRQSADNRGAPFLVLDKRAARVWVFDAASQPLGSSPVLLGLARGDDSAPGIGDRPLRQIKPDERTTPAGRFVVEPGRNTGGEEVLWIDYDAAVSMHRVRPLNPKEHRLERLASPTPLDNRISFGCINVPVAFFERVLQPNFEQPVHGIAYVLPETRPLAAVFPFAAAVTAR